MRRHASVPAMRGIGAAFLFMLASAAASAQPLASSADGPLSCLFDEVTAEQRTLAAPAALQRLSDFPPDGEARGGAALDAILASLPRCAESGRWSEDQREMAELYLMAQLGREEMRRHYAAQNVDLSFIDESLRAAATEPPRFDELVARLRDQGVTDDRPDSAGDIVHLYLELAAMAEAIPADFAELGANPR